MSVQMGFIYETFVFFFGGNYAYQQSFFQSGFFTRGKFWEDCGNRTKENTEVILFGLT